MQREERIPRIDWPARVQARGFDFHTIDGEVYWDERACYRFTAGEVDRLAAASAELHERCIEAAARVIERGDYGRLRIPEAFHALIERSWSEDEPSLYGRFDLAWNGEGEPKMLEYNADTPTALLEASVVQWYWLQDVLPRADQFNSIHEKLVARWKEMRARLPADGRVHFTCASESAEDRGNLDYLRDTAMQAGINPCPIDVADIGWDGARFVDLDERPIGALFKLYPWEWMVREEFGTHLLDRSMAVIEPAWKMLLSNKAILPLLWEMFPGHPNLLEAGFEPGRFATDFVKKPIYSREGANVAITSGGRTVEQPGEYGEEGFIWQAYQELPRFGDNYTVIGSWIVGGDSAGIGVREDTSPITKDTSRFVPHYFV
ncbi:MAG TPA: glutathionylspermidine synthase family protein [Usitatibacter sp.]|nr:glutathionylspermidine synthase family protein [Usitatibacter sp.]